MSHLIYRLLKANEWERVRPILNESLPDPNTSLISVAENDDIRGILCFHLVYHGEPLWVHPDYRGKVNVAKLQKSLTDVLPKGLEYYAFTPDRKMRWIAGTCHMTPLPWDIWKGVV